MECVPLVSVEVVNFAILLLGAAVPSVAVPSLNVTVPVGVPKVAAFTVAVIVTACPKVDGFNEDTTAVDVACLFTTTAERPTSSELVGVGTNRRKSASGDYP